MRNAHALLESGGRIVVFVPADASLFGSMDRGIGHQRRYEKNELIAKLEESGFEVESIGFQNRAARLAWRLNAQVFGRRELPSAQSRVFDFLVPLMRALDGTHPSSGLSLIAIGRKK